MVCIVLGLSTRALLWASPKVFGSGALLMFGTFGGPGCATAVPFLSELLHDEAPATTAPSLGDVVEPSHPDRDDRAALSAGRGGGSRRP